MGIFKTIFKCQGNFSKDSSFETMVPDAVEGNIELKFSIGEDPKRKDSYAIYQAQNKSNAQIIIYNIPAQKGVRPTAPFQIGTYQKTNLLFLNYQVEPAEITGEYPISIEALIKGDEQ